MSSYDKNTPESIQSLFNSIAKDYDRTNTLLSFGFHHRWNRSLVREILKRHPHPTKTADLCCGTGEITFQLLQQVKKPVQVSMIDFSEEMLILAKQKGLLYPQHTLNYHQADVQHLPLPDQSLDAATIAYGIRNVKNPERCFQESFRTLRPGGVLGILELTRPSQRVLRFGHALYLSTLLPLMGKLVTSNQEAYAYLSNSIQNFTQPAVLQSMLQRAGFRNTEHIPLMGGIASILIATKNVPS